MSAGRWQELAHHVLATLESLNEGQEKLEGRIRHLEIEVAMLKVKATLWGGAGGALAAGVAAGVAALAG